MRAAKALALARESEADYQARLAMVAQKTDALADEMLEGGASKAVCDQLRSIADDLRYQIVARRPTGAQH